MTRQQRLLLSLTALVLMAAGTWEGVSVLMNWKRARNAERYLPLLNAVETQLGIPRDLLARMAYQESHFRDDIVNGATSSGAGALGIMQIVPVSHPDISRIDILDPAKAILYAGRFLVSLFHQFGSWEKAVAAYNFGPGNVASGKPLPAETRNYVADIFSDLGGSVA